jgi:hypothetical protein
MTDYTVRELMDKALEGLELPAEDITESVLAHAAHRQRRRRTTTVLASSVGLAAVVGAVAVTNLAFPRTADGATAGRKPGSVTLTAPPAAHPSATRPAVNPVAVVSGLLPAGSGTVVKLKPQPPTSAPSDAPPVTVYPQSPFDGTYLVRRDGRTAAVIIQSYNPDAAPAEEPLGGGDLSHACSDYPPSWDCRVTTLPDGAQMMETTQPPGTWAVTAGTVSCVLVEYPDGRAISVEDNANTAGVRESTDFGPGWPNPPMDRAQLAAFAENPVWFG